LCKFAFMNKCQPLFLCCLIGLLVCGNTSCQAQSGETANSANRTTTSAQAKPIPNAAAILIKAYPAYLDYYADNYLYFKDGSKMLFDDGQADKSFDDLFNQPDVEDQLRFAYPLGSEFAVPVAEKDNPGRIRQEAFFKKMYGSTEAEARAQLTQVVWLPKNIGQNIPFSQVNGAAQALQAVSNELDDLVAQQPEMLKYLQNIGGTFNWRTIRNTPNRLSPHSFGFSIDINTTYTNYWQWDNPPKYRNQIPWAIVEIFERHKFIWGGKWYHYDTMHFEYRPEFFVE